MNLLLEQDLHDVLAGIVASTPPTPAYPFAAGSTDADVDADAVDVHVDVDVEAARPTVSTVRASTVLGSTVLGSTVLAADRDLDGPRRPAWLSAAAILLVVAAVASLTLVLQRHSSAEDLHASGSVTQPWQRVPDPNGVFIASDQFDQVTSGTTTSSANSMVIVSQVIDYRGGYLAVGTVDVGFQAGGAVWTSPDGVTWSTADQQRQFGVPHDPAASGGYGTTLGNVATRGDRLVAIGATYVRNRPPTPTAWWSDDGIHWTKSASSFAPKPTGNQWSAITGIVATSSGFIAYGDQGTAIDPEETSRVWVSIDGQTWMRTTLPGLGADAHVAGITTVGDRLLAFGSVGVSDRGDAQFWQSIDDGATWTKLDTPAAAVGMHTTVGRVLSTSYGLVAFGDAHLGDRGIDGTPGPDANVHGVDDIVEWMSTDEGRTWRVVDTAALNTADLDNITAAASGPDGIVLSIRRLGKVPLTTTIVRTADGQHFQTIPFSAHEAIDTLTATSAGYIGTGTPYPVDPARATTTPENTTLWLLPT